MKHLSRHKFMNKFTNTQNKEGKKSTIALLQRRHDMRRRYESLQANEGALVKKTSKCIKHLSHLSLCHESSFYRGPASEG